MKVNTIQIDTYSQKAANNAAAKTYSVLINGEKYVIDAYKNTVIQNSTAKDAVFGANSAALASKKGYSVLINGEKYIVGVGKGALAKTSGAKKAVFDIFKKLSGSNKANNSLNLLA